VDAISYLDERANGALLARARGARHAAVPAPAHAAAGGPAACTRALTSQPARRGKGGVFSSETAAHALRLMVFGLFDRHPTPKVVLGHCGEGLPFVLASR